MHCKLNDSINSQGCCLLDPPLTAYLTEGDLYLEELQVKCSIGGAHPGLTRDFDFGTRMT